MIALLRGLIYAEDWTGIYRYLRGRDITLRARDSQGSLFQHPDAQMATDYLRDRDHGVPAWMAIPPYGWAELIGMRSAMVETDDKGVFRHGAPFGPLERSPFIRNTTCSCCKGFGFGWLPSSPLEFPHWASTKATALGLEVSHSSTVAACPSCHGLGTEPYFMSFASAIGYVIRWNSNESRVEIVTRKSIRVGSSNLRAIWYPGLRCHLQFGFSVQAAARLNACTFGLFFADLEEKQRRKYLKRCKDIDGGSATKETPAAVDINLIAHIQNWLKDREEGCDCWSCQNFQGLPEKVESFIMVLEAPSYSFVTETEITNRAL